MTASDYNPLPRVHLPCKTMMNNSARRDEFIRMYSEKGYGYGGKITDIRKDEYPQLGNQEFFDHASTTLYAQSALKAFMNDLSQNLYGNPHSGQSPSARHTSERIARVRGRVLRLFGCPPGEYDVIFTANATASIKLVSEIIPWTEKLGDELWILREAHTSLLGLRATVPQNINVRQLTEDEIDAILREGSTVNGKSNGSLREQEDSVAEGSQQFIRLFAYPAQCNFSGARFPLDWTQRLRRHFAHHESQTLVLVDAASLVVTAPLDLSELEDPPDFIAVSFYKMFGMPTGLGALLVRKNLAPILRKRYFGGGTVLALSGEEPWQIFRHALHERYEDGTVNFLDIIALDHSLDTFYRLYTDFSHVSDHVMSLAYFLYNQMREMRHANGMPVCEMYTRDPEEYEEQSKQGPIVAFNLRRGDGAWVGYVEVERLASMHGFHLRTGGFCNVGSVQRFLNWSTPDLRKNFAAGHVCGDDTDIIDGRPTGAVRLSLGAMSTIDDVLKWLNFLETYFVDRKTTSLISPVCTDSRDGHRGNFVLDAIALYPIKSCRGFFVKDWPLTSHGLLYDREWMVIDEVTGQALSQKRYTQMTFIRPTIDLSRRLLLVHAPHENSLEIPLDILPEEDGRELADTCPSRVCGDSIDVYRYKDPAISDWFSRVLGIPCILVRQPSHTTLRQIKPQFVSPVPQAISLQNESPFLLISQQSVNDIQEKTSTPVAREQFRGNLYIRGLPPYAEEKWRRFAIGGQRFCAIGACRRCNMVCINPETGERQKEPFTTLAKYRRKGPKRHVVFGIHAVWQESASKVPFRLRVGDEVVVLEEVESDMEI
ncbi:uncharacterized protein VTP21DRAFT_2628 [Calcarisporiella thermophila]|uniref:uncharacterized protein n=1 Tax=Calcarisporiella thermophila TaxID=911321 RepID=UPI00374267FD